MIWQEENYTSCLLIRKSVRSNTGKGDLVGTVNKRCDEKDVLAIKEMQRIWKHLLKLIVNDQKNLKFK